MKAGVSSFAFGWAITHGVPPVDEHALVAFARRHGLAAIQVADNLPVHTWPEPRLSSFIAACAASSLQIELGARGLTETHLETSLRLCECCGARLLRFVVDSPGYEPDVDHLTALLRSVTPTLIRRGVTLAIENHDRFGVRTLRRMVDAVSAPCVGICLDTANSFGAGEGLAYVTEWLAEVTVNVHVKDVTIARLSHLGGFSIEGAALGEGCLPVIECLGRVAQAGRCETAILEGWTSPGATHADTLARERASAAHGAAVLQSMLAPLA